MPPKPLRVVRLRRAPPYNKERMRLLTYRMALAQPESTVPLLESKQHALPLADTHSNHHARPAPKELGKPQAEGRASSTALGYTHRWIRDPEELCVASIRRSNNINRISSYVATYKFNDPHWRPFLLPEVHVLPKSRRSTHTDSNHNHNSTNNDKNNSNDDDSNSSSRATERFSKATPASEELLPNNGEADGSQPPPGKSASNSAAADYDVFIDYSKLVNLELISRHANFALRHLVQKGHAMYFVNFAQHSLLAMRGVVETSYLTCAYGVRGERLRTMLTHVGPLDVREVIEIDPHTHRVRFNFERPQITRGVVALSQVEGYATWFQRKPMLWQRTRRIGALQAGMGAYAYTLCPPATVGRLREYEVALLDAHVKEIGGGACAVGLLAASQIAQNRRLYLGQFEAPAVAALDAVQQLAHHTALHHGLLRPAREEGNNVEPAKKIKEEEELRSCLAMERLLPVSWVTRTPPPYVPLEADLPFRMQLSRPAVLRVDVGGDHANQSQTHAVYPTSGTVGAPFVKGAPLVFTEYVLHQGVDHYVFDDAPSARPMKWWNQKSNMPYNGHIYFVRSGLLDRVVPAEKPPNPLATRAQRPRPPRPDRTKKAKKTQKMKKGEKADQTEKKESDEGVEAWSAARGPNLVGYDDNTRATRAETMAIEQQQHEEVRPSIADIIPLGNRAASRVAVYEQLARTMPKETEGLDRSKALLKRQLRLRQRRRQSGPAATNQPDETKPPSEDRAPDTSNPACAGNEEDNKHETSRF